MLPSRGPLGHKPSYSKPLVARCNDHANTARLPSFTHLPPPPWLRPQTPRHCHARPTGGPYRGLAEKKGSFSNLIAILFPANGQDEIVLRADNLVEVSLTGDCARYFDKTVQIRRGPKVNFHLLGRRVIGISPAETGNYCPLLVVRFKQPAQQGTVETVTSG